MALDIEPTAAKDLLEHMSVDLERMPPEIIADLQRRTLEACQIDNSRRSAYERLQHARQERDNSPADSPTDRPSSFPFIIMGYRISEELRAVCKVCQPLAVPNWAAQRRYWSERSLSSFQSTKSPKQYSLSISVTKPFDSQPLMTTTHPWRL